MNSARMKDLPNPFWALLFMFLGCVLLVAVLFKVTAYTSQIEVGLLMAVATAGSNIISGAFGYIQGRSDGKASALPDPPPPGSTATADTHVEVNTPPTQAVTPPKEQP